MAPTADNKQVQHPQPPTDGAAGAGQADKVNPASDFSAKKLCIATATVAATVLVVFLANMAYLFGSTMHQSRRNHAYTIAAVNYDASDSAIWDAFAKASNALAADTFATVVTLDSAAYPSPDQLVLAVRQQEYWGALFVNRDAASTLAAAIAGNNSSYDPRQAVTYVWDELRYPSVAASVILGGIQQLQAAAKGIYQAGAAQQLLRGAASARGRTAVAAFVDPFDAAEINVTPAPQAEKAFYNTVLTAIAIVQQNVFLIAFAGISRATGLFSRPFKTSGTWALVIGVVYTLLTSLVTTGYVWAFSEDWVLSAGQFFTTWMAMWLIHHINYQLIDGTLALVPIQAFSFILVTFVFVTVSSTVFPLESSPRFYVWGRALPGYQAFQVLLNVWTRSSHKLYEQLPILFSWWVVSGLYAAAGTLKKVQRGRAGATTGAAEQTAVTS